MRIGKSRHKVQIEKPPRDAEDEFGHNDDTRRWPVHAFWWAEISDSSGRESFDREQINGTVNYLMTGRYVSGVNTKMRVRYGERVFNISSAINVGELGKELRLTCTENV